MISQQSPQQIQQLHPMQAQVNLQAGPDYQLILGQCFLTTPPGNIRISGCLIYSGGEEKKD